MAGQGVNKVFLLGNVGRDPELRYTGSGKAVANFTLATSEGSRGEGGEPRTEWHRIVVWDRLAEQCSNYVTKGRQVFIEGRLQTRSWEDRNQQKRQTTEIVAHNVQFLGTGRGEGANRPPPHGDTEYPPFDARQDGGSGGYRQAGPQGGGGGDGGGGGGGGGGYRQGPPQDRGGPPPQREQAPPARKEPEVPYADEDDEDIPF